MARRAATTRAAKPTRPAEPIFIFSAQPPLEELQVRDAEGREVPLEEVKKAWRKVTGQMAEIISATDRSMFTTYRLSTIAIGLKVSGKVKDIFGLTEFGAEVSITLTITVQP